MTYIFGFYIIYFVEFSNNIPTKNNIKDNKMSFFEIYNPVLNLDEKACFNLLLASEFGNKPTEHFKRNDHKYYTFNYVIEGSGTITVGNQKFHPKAKDVFIMPKGIKHEGKTTPTTPWLKLYFDVSGWMIEELLRAHNLSDCYYIPDCRLEAHFRKMLQIASQNLPSTHDKAFLLFHKILIKLKNSNYESMVNYSLTVRNTILYITQNIESNMTMTDIADHVGKSPEHIIRVFKNEVNKTPYAYMLEKKIDLAKLLLINTNMPIKKIAQRLNYSDEYYFSATFKKHTGTSPTKYRAS